MVGWEDPCCVKIGVTVLTQRGGSTVVRCSPTPSWSDCTAPTWGLYSSKMFSYTIMEWLYCHHVGVALPAWSFSIIKMGRGLIQVTPGIVTEAITTSRSHNLLILACGVTRLKRELLAVMLKMKTKYQQWIKITLLYNNIIFQASERARLIASPVYCGRSIIHTYFHSFS